MNSKSSKIVALVVAVAAAGFSKSAYCWDHNINLAIAPLRIRCLNSCFVAERAFVSS